SLANLSTMTIRLVLTAVPISHVYTLSLHDALPIFLLPRPGARHRRPVGRPPGPGRGCRGPARPLLRRGPRHRGDPAARDDQVVRSEEHTSELQSRFDLVCRLLLVKKKREEANRKHR